MLTISVNNCIDVMLVKVSNIVWKYNPAKTICQFPFYLRAIGASNDQHECVDMALIKSTLI